MVIQRTESCEMENVLSSDVSLFVSFISSALILNQSHACDASPLIQSLAIILHTSTGFLTYKLPLLFAKRPVVSKPLKIRVQPNDPTLSFGEHHP